MKNTSPKDIKDFFKKQNLKIAESDLDYYDTKDNIIYTATIWKMMKSGLPGIRMIRIMKLQDFI